MSDYPRDQQDAAELSERHRLKESMTYQIAEKFKSIQGEGVFAGTPMAFIRFVGCSVGKKTCHFCDTDFDKTMNWRGGGSFSAQELALWSIPYEHICLTGGEPLDQDLLPLVDELNLRIRETVIHVETSGTKSIPTEVSTSWICVSPKPGFIDDVVLVADEVKVIVPGLGNGAGWPTIKDALRWASMSKIVFLQPRNEKFAVDKNNLRLVQDIITEHPELRLSLQLHKLLGVQ